MIFIIFDRLFLFIFTFAERFLQNLAEKVFEKSITAVAHILIQIEKKNSQITIKNEKVIITQKHELIANSVCQPYKMLG
ncbi:hypothetical protein TTHERM_00716330 (macronuclear) [Tetrahymena thermophila SB210]|uniref:Transmembrane protein n=1 Tax=Tetrahymena thermophila (strain SB210) TaxID=312017 RepID=I7M658_TETTS|nr:hypothetical protein TTHERM_00716330 [Tetrahymena thermophila SB210]EAR84327.1 hypothetical protein TTHERM_00716330 [Tetrahymena thermophila SB210]|eukprot:XP_001031990.1 hypothetical protein TTHERM_00716330 [Tetrahymena thermophila SB210]